MDKVLQLFASLGFPLTHFPENGDFRELYQYDGGLKGVVVQLYFSINGVGKLGTFGIIDQPDGSSMDIACSVEDWDKPDWVEWVKKGLGL
jgi:hypothetical protein